MKNSKSKLTDAQLSDRQLKLTDADKMPESVATSMLCECGRRMSGSERRMYQRARQREFLSVRLRKPRSVKLKTRAQNATMEQLLTWTRRADKARRGLQFRYHVLLELPGDDLRVQAMINALDRRAALVDSAIDVLDEERKFRNDLTRGVLHHGGTALRDFFGRTLVFNLAKEKKEFSRWLLSNA